LITFAMSMYPIFRSRKCFTATSFAADRTAGMLPPARMAS